MSTISKKLVGFLFSGPALALASAPFRGNVNALYGFNAAGTGYTSFNPANAFNSLAQLVPDGSYILDAKTTGFDLPGATFTAAAGLRAGPLTVDQVSLNRDDDGGYLVSLRVRSSDADDRAGYLVEVLAHNEQGELYQVKAEAVDASYVYNGGSIVLSGIPAADTGSVRVTNRLGYSVVQEFQVPAHTTNT